MDDLDFEGTLVLEQIASIGKIDEFFAAIDADDFKAATDLMKRANVDLETITLVLQKMREASGEH